MIGRFCIVATTTLVLALATPLSSQEQQHQEQQGANCPMHQKHQAEGGSHAEMDMRGDRAMGFSQSKTAHHFLLKRDGGSIEVEALNEADQASIGQIRQHLTEIARQFSEGNFDSPVFIHAQTPPGVPAMKRLKAEIKYEFEKTERGGRVSIQTNNPEALTAVHQFLRFQIEEHRTGDMKSVVSSQ